MREPRGKVEKKLAAWLRSLLFVVCACLESVKQTPRGILNPDRVRANAGLGHDFGFKPDFRSRKDPLKQGLAQAPRLRPSKASSRKSLFCTLTASRLWPLTVPKGIPHNALQYFDEALLGTVTIEIPVLRSMQLRRTRILGPLKRGIVDDSPKSLGGDSVRAHLPNRSHKIC